jgi:hypothetical protein
MTQADSPTRKTGAAFWFSYLAFNAVALVVAATSNMSFFQLALSGVVFVTGGVAIGIYCTRIRSVVLRVVTIASLELVLLVIVSDGILKWRWK